MQTDVTIPSSIRTILDYAFATNNLRTITYNESESNILFCYCPFTDNINYPKWLDYCGR